MIVFVLFVQISVCVCAASGYCDSRCNGDLRLIECNWLISDWRCQPVYRFEVPIFAFVYFNPIQNFHSSTHWLVLLPLAPSGSSKKRYERSLNTTIQNGFSASPKADGTHGAPMSIKPVALRKYHLQPDRNLCSLLVFAFSVILNCIRSHVRGANGLVGWIMAIVVNWPQLYRC